MLPADRVWFGTGGQSEATGECTGGQSEATGECTGGQSEATGECTGGQSEATGECTVWQVTSPVPLYIPQQVCDTVGKDPATTPPDACMDLLHADLREDGVTAPDVPGGRVNADLAQVVADAKQKGIDLKVVVLPQNPPIDTPLRDVATEVGQVYPGSTVLVLSPSFAGTYSPTVDRVTLEAGQDIAKISGNPVAASQNFVTELTTPHFPWTPFTLLLVLGVAIAAVATRILQVRARRADSPEKPVAAAN